MILIYKRQFLLAIVCSAFGIVYGQDSVQTIRNSTLHFQTTVIAQRHTAFHSSYSGPNSLADTAEPTATSLTGTLFMGRRLWKGAAFYFNPEVSGGKGLSFATGVAGALNGETYRVGEVAPEVFVARAYLQQNFPLGKTTYEYVADDVNQIADKIPTSRITISAGRFAISDFYDNNTYSKDPRSQFFNWAIWANGAWDYPANTRGYTYGLVTELIKPTWAIRLSTVAVPRIANFHLMEYNKNAHSETLELEHSLSINKHKGAARFIVSNTYSQAPSYTEGIKALTTGNQFLLDVIQGETEHKAYGGHKLGLGINVEQELSSNAGVFVRTGWNDGKYATWAFTEIDRTISTGFSIIGTKWRRKDDVWAIAGVVNGISDNHREFLKKGGTGFIIGDGTLTYGHEAIIETYYNARIGQFLYLSFDYQFVNHPGYNKDRGPVHVFGVRGHVEF